MYERSCVKVKVGRGSTFTLTCDHSDLFAFSPSMLISKHCKFMTKQTRGDWVITAPSGHDLVYAAFFKSFPS